MTASKIIETQLRSHFTDLFRIGHMFIVLVCSSNDATKVFSSSCA